MVAYTATPILLEIREISHPEPEEARDESSGPRLIANPQIAAGHRIFRMQQMSQ